MFSAIFRHKQPQNVDLKQLALLKLIYYDNLEKTFTFYQRNACKSIIDDVAERGSGRMTCAKKKTPFATQDLRVTLQRAGNKMAVLLSHFCSNDFAETWLGYVLS